MQTRRLSLATLVACLIATSLVQPQPVRAQATSPLVYTISFPDPASKTFTVDVVVPTDGRASVDLMMAIWSPGFYGLQNYADRVTTFSASAPDGTALAVTKPTPSRWTVESGGRQSFTFSYTLSAPRGSNLSNGVTETGAVIIGPSTYVTLVEQAHRPADVQLRLPPSWTGSMTSLDAAPDGRPNHYVAPDYDVLADSPILAGADLTTTAFTVGGIEHFWTYLGPAEWDGAKVAAAITPLIEEHIRFWRGLPYKKYAFLNIVTSGRGGSGVEHLNSVAITGGGREPADQTARFRNAVFLSHEYFHAMNVKRLRPVELGPFDYEHAPVTTGLWVGEGLTSYFGDLLAARAGMGSADDYLATCSRHITDLQTKQPGRLVQTLEQASSQMFERLPRDQTVDYYVKGPVVGLVLDAHIRRATNGQKSMDDVMRLERERWSGARGYTGAEFNKTMSDAAGFDVEPLLHQLIATTEEIDYTEMLDWFGLRFMAGDPAMAWTLEVCPDATPDQRQHFADLLAPSRDIQIRGPQDAILAEEAPPNAIWLDSLDLTKMVQRRQTPRARQALARGRGRGAGAAAGGSPIVLGGVTYPHGIGTLSINELIVDLKGQATRFVAMVGLDDVASAQGTVTVEAWVDNVNKFRSPVLRTGDAPMLVDIDLTGARFLELFIDDGGDVSTGDNADWGGGLIYLKPGATAQPESWTFPTEAPQPIASGDPASPRINAPRITGGTPGRWFMFKIPATGDGPLTYAARNLPAGLTLDSTTGIITGAIARAGTTIVDVSVTNSQGRADSQLTIVGGDDALALTPPLGWNSWNVWGGSVDDAKVRAAADAMVSSGLAAHGYQFINIDDGWEARQRDENGVLPSNEKFPDMKALADYVHSKGLKIGIYSSPGPRTCQGLPGSYQHEDIDAQTWAGWGFDVLKHDWCSYSGIAKDDSLPELQKPFIVMRDALRKTGRDIIYSLCQYGMGNVWEWGADVGGNYWRTTGDLTDVWSNMSAVGFRQAGREQWSKPGHWTDPDMLVIGKVGWGPDIHDTRLTPNEQLTHISLWALQAAPLLIGADMSQFDQFTTDLMTNHEVMEISQDVLGRGAARVYQRERLEMWARPLADGTMAVGLFNRGLQAETMTATWSELGLTGTQPVRDVWAQRDLGSQPGAFSTRVPAHGVVMVKIGRTR